MQVYRTLYLIFYVVFSLAPVACTPNRPTSFIIGKPIPNLGTIELLQKNKTDKIKDFRRFDDKVIVLEFWATWCSPCLKAIKHMNSLSRKFVGSPVEFISITDESEAAIRKFLTNNHIDGLVGRINKNLKRNLLGIPSLPTVVVIDKSGGVATITHPAFLTAKHLKKILDGQTVVLPPPMEKEKILDINDGPQPDFLAMIRHTIEDQHNPTRIGKGVLEQFDVSIIELIAQAFRLTPCRVIHSSMVPDGHYDMVIRQAGKSTNVLRNTMKSVLGDAFGFKFKKEKREMQVLVFSLKSEDKEIAVESNSGTGPSMLICDDRRITAKNAPMNLLTDCLERKLEIPVLDHTNLKGKYSFELEFSFNKDKNLLLNAINSSLDEKLGLLLSHGKEDTEVLVVE